MAHIAAMHGSIVRNSPKHHFRRYRIGRVSVSSEMVLGAVSDYAAVHCGYVGHHCAVLKTASFCGIKSAACDSRCIGCEYAAVDRLPVLLQLLSRFLLSP